MKKIFLSTLVIFFGTFISAQVTNQANTSKTAYLFDFEGDAAANCSENKGVPKYTVNADHAPNYYKYTFAGGKLTLVKDCSVLTPLQNKDGWRGFRVSMHDASCSQVVLDMSTVTKVEVKVNSTVAVPQFWIAFYDALNDRWTDNKPDMKPLIVGDNLITFTIGGADFWTQYANTPPYPVVDKTKISELQLYFRTAWDNNNPSGTFVIDYIKVGETTGIGIEEESNKKPLNIFPSPATNVVNVNFEAKENSTVSLTDITGRILAIQNVSMGTQNLKFNVDNYSEGLYLITISGASGQHTEKLIIK